MIRSCLDDIRPSASTIFRRNTQHNLTGHVCASHGRIPGKTPHKTCWEMGKRFLSSTTVQLLGQNRLQSFNLPLERHSQCAFLHKLRSHNFDTSILRTPLHEHAFLSLCDDHQPRICQ